MSKSWLFCLASLKAEADSSGSFAARCTLDWTAWVLLGCRRTALHNHSTGREIEDGRMLRCCEDTVGTYVMLDRLSLCFFAPANR